MDATGAGLVIMKRRRFFQTAAGALPAASIALAQGPVSGTAAAAEDMLGFFSAPQFAALKRVSSLLMPKTDKAPGALEADAPGFLDFLIGKSPADRQELYRTGLDLLN